LIGKVIAGRYRITSQLGAGGMGSVWRAEHLTLGSPVAIKLIDESIAKHPEVLARFEREAQAAASLRSPHVVQVLDYGVDDKTPFIAMELLDGESLEERLERLGKLSLPETVRIITQVARAIARAHEIGIVHRDLKPGNIFLVRNDDDEVAKVLDFGIAKKDETAATTTRTGAMVGTPAYMSPEQAQGSKQLDGRTDLWALGAIAFECLTGALPFDGEALGELIVKICTTSPPVPSTLAPLPPAFDAWFAKALAKDRTERFQTAKELSDGLRVALLGPGEPLSVDGRWATGTLIGTGAGDASTKPAMATSVSATTANGEASPPVPEVGAQARKPVSGGILAGAAAAALVLGYLALRGRGTVPAESASEEPSALVSAATSNPGGAPSDAHADATIGAAPATAATAVAPSSAATPSSAASAVPSTVPVASAHPSSAASTHAPSASAAPKTSAAPAAKHGGNTPPSAKPSGKSDNRLGF
jgi:serine/threonine protein kinase